MNANIPTQPEDNSESGVRAALRRLRWRRVALGAVAVTLALTASAYGIYRTTLSQVGPLSLDGSKAMSVTVVDRDGK